MLLAVLFALFCGTASSFYIPLIAPVEYSRGQSIEIKVRKKFTMIMYSLYWYLILDPRFSQTFLSFNSSCKHELGL